MKKLMIFLLMSISLCQAASMAVEKGKEEASSLSSALAAPYTSAQVAMQQEVVQLAAPQEEAVQELAPLEIRIEHEGTRITLFRDGQEIVNFDSEIMKISKVAENVLENERWINPIEAAVNLMFKDLNDDKIILMVKILTTRLKILNESDAEHIMNQISIKDGDWLLSEFDRLDIPLSDVLMHHLLNIIYLKLLFGFIKNNIPMTITQEGFIGHGNAYYTNDKDVILLNAANKIVRYNLKNKNEDILFKSPRFLNFIQYNKNKTRLIAVTNSYAYILDNDGSLITEFKHIGTSSPDLKGIGTNFSNNETKLIIIGSNIINIYDISSKINEKTINIHDLIFKNAQSPFFDTDANLLLHSSSVNYDEQHHMLTFIVSMQKNKHFIVYYNVIDHGISFVQMGMLQGNTLIYCTYNYSKTKIAIVSNSWNKHGYMVSIYDLQKNKFEQHSIVPFGFVDHISNPIWDEDETYVCVATQDAANVRLLWLPTDTGKMTYTAHTITFRAMGIGSDMLLEQDPYKIGTFILSHAYGFMILSLLPPSKELWQSLDDKEVNFLFKAYDEAWRYDKPYVINPLHSDEAMIHLNLPEVLKNNKWFQISHKSQSEIIEEQPSVLQEAPDFRNSSVKDTFAKIGSKATAIYNSFSRWWVGQQEQWPADRQ